jgi:hypothetical protein
MMTDFNNNQRYHLAIGYGDDWSWDLGQDDYWSDSLEELFEEICTDLSFDEIVEMLNKEGFAEDDGGMWYLGDNFWD